MARDRTKAFETDQGLLVTDGPFFTGGAGFPDFTPTELTLYVRDNGDVLVHIGTGDWVLVTSGESSTNWQKYTITPQGTADIYESQDLFTLAAKGYIKSIIIHHTQNFTGGSVTESMVSVGTSTDHTRYTPKHTVFGGAGGANFLKVDLVDGLESMTATTDVKVWLETMTDTISNLTQGSVDIYVERETLP